MRRSVLEPNSRSCLGLLIRQLAKRGTVAVAVLRLAPIAPFAVFNLAADVSNLEFRQFMVGSLVGITPGLGAIALLSGTLWAALTEPTWKGVATAVSAGCGLMGIL